MWTDGNHGDNDGGGLRKWTAAALSRAWRRGTADAWLLLQRTIAATAAWAIAKHIFDHHEPFFAPIAAVGALNASLGERGSNALRLLLGVGVGIVVGELTVGLLGGGYGTLALSTFVAMTIAPLWAVRVSPSLRRQRARSSPSPRRMVRSDRSGSLTR